LAASARELEKFADIGKFLQAALKCKKGKAFGLRGEAKWS
jgi:hypothetical protein